MLNQDGKISAHYVDSIGFKELPGFLDKKQERSSVLQNLKEKCDAPGVQSNWMPESEG